MATKKKELSKKERIARLNQEYGEVKSRLDRLNVALEREDFADKVGIEQYNLLIEQAGYMRDYRDILAVRIKLLEFTEVK